MIEYTMALANLTLLSGMAVALILVLELAIADAIVAFVDLVSSILPNRRNKGYP